MPSMSTLLRPGYAKRQSDAIVGTSVLQFGTPKKSSSTARTPASQARRKKPGQRKVAVQESPNLDDESSVSTKTPATLKRSAVEANLDDEQAPLSTKEPRLDTVSDEQTATGSERLLGSLNQDERTEIMSPTTPAPQEESTIIEPASFSAAFPKKRGRPSKATLAERAGETASPSTPATKKVARPKKKPFSSVRAPGTELEDGVHINPPGAWELKKHVTQPRGRPPKAKIAVFKLSRLHDFPWYTADVPSSPAKSPEQALRKSLSASRSPSSTEPPPATEHEEPSNTQAVTHDSLPRIQATQEEPENVVDDTNKPPQEDQPAATFNENAPPQDSTEELNLTATSAEGVAPPDDKSDPSQQNIEKDDPVDDNLPDITVDSMSDHNGPSKKYKKAGVTKGFGALPIMRRNIVLDIIRSCGGIFPGKGEIWFPFATFWQRKHKQTPDRHTVDNVVKGIISSGRIKKLTFFFKSRKGLTVERAIFAEPGIDPNSPQVKQLQKRIIDNFPATVLPEEADVSPELRRQAARNSQITNLAKLAKQGSGISSPAPSVQAGAQQPASHYIRDQFPQDTTLTVKRVGHPSGLGATDAALASIKRSKQLNRVRKAGRKRQYGNVYLDDEDGIGEMTFEQAMLQGEQDLFGQRYKRSAASSRLARMRGSAAGARRLPGRILASKSARRDPNALAIATGIRTRSLPWNAIGYVASQSAHSKVEPAFRAISTGTRTTRSLPWNALGYVPSQSAHSKVTPDFKAITTQTLVLPKRAGRIQWQWADPSLADWSVQPSNGAMSGLYSNESSSFGLLLPNDAQIVHGDYFDVQRAPQNLNEIVNSHWLPSSPYADDEANEATRFFDEVDRVEAWERRLIKARQGLVRGSDRPFINYTTPAITSQPYIGRYLPGMQMNTLSGRRKRAGLYGIEDVPSPKRVRLAPARRLLSETDPRKYKKRDRRAAARFTEKDYDRLAKAIALVSVVAGGLSYRRNWYITAHALRYRFEPEFLRHRWEKIRDQRNPVVKQMQAQIWEPFLDAYERGVLPRVDFETLENTDWPALMDWVHTEVAMSPMDNTKSAAIFNKVPELPATEQELQSDFKITELEAPSVSREEAFTAVVDKRRRDVVLSCVNGVALESEKPQEIDHKANELLRSWTRAIVLTNDKSYNQLEAYNKITKFGDKALDATIRDLCAEKILQAKKKGRRLPGRNLKLDETAVLTMFKRWSDKQGPEHLFLTRVAERREEVLEVLRHQDHYDLAYSAEDELYIVLTNMVGQGLLKVRSKLPERNDDFDAPFPKLTAWGYSGYNYNVRTFDKTRLRFSIVYEKTDKFTFEHGLRTDIPLPTEPPLFPGEDEPRIPLWVDIHGELLPRMWEMVLRSVLYLVVFRPGIDSAGIQEAHRSKLWSWEIEVMMKWMEETGLAERAGPGREINGLWKGGWKANAWWYCALCPDVAKWPALNEWAEEFSVPT